MLDAIYRSTTNGNMRATFIITVLCLAHSALGSDTCDADSCDNIVAMDATPSNNMFGLDLFKLIFKDDPSQNTFMSPFSISVALAMTHLGARGVTADDMSSTLNWSPGEEEAMHAGFQTYIKMLQKTSDSYQLSTANRLFIEKNYPILDQFLTKTKELYLAEPELSDFTGAAESERQRINTWVSEQTNAKIQDLLPAGVVDSLTRMILVNAIYFKGKWEKEFDPELTKPDMFKMSKSQSKMVDMMFMKRKFAYVKDSDLGCTAVEIPYKGNDLGMVIILPDDDFGLESLVDKLTSDKLRGLLNDLDGRKPEVELKLPKFEITSSFGLKDKLSTLGMARAFDDSLADFSGMTAKKELILSDVVHKAFVQVNEEGTEAAAATAAVMMARCAVIPRDPLKVTVDHPFLLVIRDNRARGIILFMGHVVDPLTQS